MAGRLIGFIFELSELLGNCFYMKKNPKLANISER